MSNVCQLFASLLALEQAGAEASGILGKMAV